MSTLPAPHLPVRLASPRFAPDALHALTEILESGMLVQGARVARFEAAVAQALTDGDRTPHAVACSSGTAALHLALLALDLKAGEEVILPDLTFPATLNMVVAAGGVPRVVDVDLHTGNLLVSQVEAAINARTRAILPVHLFGLCADLAPLLALAERHGIPVLEDAACALGATWPDQTGSPRPVGSQSWAACLSFHPRKIVTTGEGGMIVTHSASLAERLRQLRNHGASPRAGRMDFHEVGFNLRLTELQGALGVSQLAELSRHLEARQRLAHAYSQALTPLSERYGLLLPQVPSGFHHVWQSYVVLIPPGVSRDAVADGLKAQQVESTLGSYALHRIPVFQSQLGLHDAAFPGADMHVERSLALPIHSEMHQNAVDYVARALDATLGVLMGAAPAHVTPEAST